MKCVQRRSALEFTVLKGASILLFVFLASTAALLAGCGGGSTNSTPAPVPVSIVTTGPINEQASTQFSATLSATGGTPPYSYSVSGGALPANVSLSSDGVLSGATSAAGAFAFAVAVKDSSTTPLTASASFTLNIYTAAVSVNAGSVLQTLPATAYGIHTSVYDSGLANVAGLPPALAVAGIGVMRYPGGLYSDNYHWAQYTMTPFAPPAAAGACNSTSGSPVTTGYLAGNTDFGHFVATLQAVKAQAIITINYGSSVANSTASKTAESNGSDDCSEPNTSGQPEEAAAWVAYANGSPTSTQSIGVDAAGFNWQTVGYWAGLRAATPLATDDGSNFLRIGQSTPVGVAYWELGNELFYNGYNNNQNSETDLHSPYIYPNGFSSSNDTFDSRAGVSALSPASYGTNVIAYINAMKAVDPTIKIGLVLSSPNVDPIPATWNPSAIEAVCSGATFNFGIFHYYPGTFLGSTASQLLSLPQTDIPTLVANAKTQIAQYCKASTNPVQFFITETDTNSGLASGTPTQVIGLYATNIYLAALQAGIANVDWLELHNNTNFLTNSGTAETPGAAFYGVELAHLLAAAGDQLVTTTSTGSQVISYASIKANGQAGVLLINANSSTSATVLVTVTGNAISGSATQYSFGVDTSQSSDTLSSSSFSVSGQSFLVTVPAYTATTIILP